MGAQSLLIVENHGSARPVANQCERAYCRARNNSNAINPASRSEQWSRVVPSEGHPLHSQAKFEVSSGDRAIRRLSRSIALTVLVGASVSCARVTHFDAQPRTVCLGDSVQVSWSASGSVALQSEPPLQQTGPKSSDGSELFAVSTNTRFLLVAKRLWSSDKAERDVQVTPESVEYGDYAHCDAGAQSLSSKVTLASPQLSPSLKVRSITNRNHRTIVLQKAGACDAPGGCVSVTLDDGGTTSELAGPAIGQWTITAPLRQGEQCHDALTSVSSQLSLQFNLACNK
jgi:hypothetical protein